MNIQCIDDEGVSVISLSGRFDVHSSPEFRRSSSEVMNAGCNRIVVDLAEVEEIDGFGLAVLVGLMSRLRKVGGKMVLTGVNPELRQRFEMTWLEGVFPTYITVAQATTEMKK